MATLFAQVIFYFENIRKDKSTYLEWEDVTDGSWRNDDGEVHSVQPITCAE